MDHCDPHCLKVSLCHVTLFSGPVAVGPTLASAVVSAERRGTLPDRRKVDDEIDKGRSSPWSHVSKKPGLTFHYIVLLMRSLFQSLYTK